MTATVPTQAQTLPTEWRDYFALETQLAASGMVDVLAHPDQIKYWGIRPAADVMEQLYPPVVEAAARSSVAIEVSSAGLRREAAEVYPAPSFLAKFAAAGVPITLASDAHVPDLAAWGHEAVVAAAKAAGYETYLRFDQRRASAAPLTLDG